ncbi:MAG: glutamine--fructose-6-phosphate transaminase (isomerizing) [Peptococcaceae bacterium]|nr:glutamine--fructose-6-phosphate transaminase (isomerizing) [Peptococcaceae bacterium]
MGVFGYIGKKNAVPILIEGIKQLGFQGFDSTGLAVFEEGRLWVAKSTGKLTELENKVNARTFNSTVGIGHTRWATHGRPCDENAHPHIDCRGDFAVVHNGIIENYLELKEWLLAEGHIFRSETDTEVLPHLIEHYYDGDMDTTVRKILQKVEGSYALIALSCKEPDMLVAARKSNSLVVCQGEEGCYLASNFSAIPEHTKNTYVLEDEEIAILTDNGVNFTDFQGEAKDKILYEVNWDASVVEKDGYDHFMLKEIYEQPKALRDTLGGRLTEEKVVLREVALTPEQIASFNKVAIVACGTAYHAGLIGRTLIERWAKIPVEIDIASEFRYRSPLIDEHTLTVVLSQSGETADTLAALREAKRLGARVVAITNVVGSSVSREAHDVIYTWAGPEIAIASTKAYTTQIEAMILLALFLAQAKGTISQEWIREIITELKKLPDKASEIFKQVSKIQQIASSIKDSACTFFVGRGLDWSVAQEGSLKLKETSYIHAEAYAAGELKHGTIALVTECTPIIALATQRDLYDKTLSNVNELKAREAQVIGITFEGNESFGQAVDEVFYLPETINELAPILTVIPLQLLAYYVSLARGNDVDRPRNLVKSVTVE